jgi:hypothetical protein
VDDDDHGAVREGLSVPDRGGRGDRGCGDDTGEDEGSSKGEEAQGEGVEEGLGGLDCDWARVKSSEETRRARPSFIHRGWPQARAQRRNTTQLRVSQRPKVTATQAARSELCWRLRTRGVVGQVEREQLAFNGS